MTGHTIAKRFTFDAGHHLPSLPAGHKCARPHGHTYTVEVQVTSTVLAQPGWVADFADLDPLKTYLQSTFDHRYLNEVVEFEPTSERLAQHLYDWCVDNLRLLHGHAQVAAVRVSETPSTWAEYRP